MTSIKQPNTVKVLFRDFFYILKCFDASVLGSRVESRLVFKNSVDGINNKEKDSAKKNTVEAIKFSFDSKNNITQLNEMRDKFIESRTTSAKLWDVSLLVTVRVLSEGSRGRAEKRYKAFLGYMENFFNCIQSELNPSPNKLQVEPTFVIEELSSEDKQKLVARLKKKEEKSNE